MSIENRLRRLEQSQARVNQFKKVDLSKLSNRELIEYRKQLEDVPLTVGKYKGRKCRDLSNEELANCKQELLAIMRKGRL